jgi:hypothetical protein
VLEGVLNSFPGADIAVLVVWIPMMRGDTLDAAAKAAGKFGDGRVEQFFDSRSMAGRAVARSLGHEGEVAWDFYLFYPVRASWLELPPVPEIFMHQLRNGWAARDRLFEKEKLMQQLSETMKRFFPLEAPGSRDAR